jgi:hypothetical protein
MLLFFARSHIGILYMLLPKLCFTLLLSFFAIHCTYLTAMVPKFIYIWCLVSFHMTSEFRLQHILYINVVYKIVSFRIIQKSKLRCLNDAKHFMISGTLYSFVSSLYCCSIQCFGVPYSSWQIYSPEQNHILRHTFQDETAKYSGQSLFLCT